MRIECERREGEGGSKGEDEDEGEGGSEVNFRVTSALRD